MDAALPSLQAMGAAIAQGGGEEPGEEWEKAVGGSGSGRVSGRGSGREDKDDWK